MDNTLDLKKYIRTVPDFPEPGIMFRDVTTLFNDAEGFQHLIKQLEDAWSAHKIDQIAGIDARGFIIGGALAYKMRLPFLALRKKGKLPYETISEEYDLEYGKAELEVHKDAAAQNASVLIVDDLIATGGTAIAGINLIRAIGARVIGCSFVIDLPEIGGAKKIAELGIEVKSLIVFDGH